MTYQNFDFKKITEEISDHFKNVSYPNGEVSDLGNEVGLALGKSLPLISNQEIEEFIRGVHHGIDLATSNSQISRMDSAYQKYYNAWMYTLNDPLTKSDFIARSISDKDFAKIWGAIPPDSSSDSIKERNDD